MIYNLVASSALLSLLTLAPSLVFAVTSTVCSWSGTAPFCNGNCDASQTNLPSPLDDCGTGDCCWSGFSKALCCQLPSCPSEFAWAENDANHDPCFLASQILAACAPASQQEILTSNGSSYALPTQDNQNTCTCASPLYALVSACSYCQGGTYTDWPTWSATCHGVHLTAADLKGIVPGIPDLPPWSWFNVTQQPSFDPAVAKDVALGIPVPDPSSSLSSSSSSTSSSSTSSASTSSSNNPSSTSSDTPTVSTPKSNHSAAIIGGTLGGLIFLVIPIVWCIARRVSAPDVPTYSAVTTAGTGHV